MCSDLFQNHGQEGNRAGRGRKRTVNITLGTIRASKMPEKSLVISRTCKILRLDCFKKITYRKLLYCDDDETLTYNFPRNGTINRVNITNYTLDDG